MHALIRWKTDLYCHILSQLAFQLFQIFVEILSAALYSRYLVIFATEQVNNIQETLRLSHYRLCSIILRCKFTTVQIVHSPLFIKPTVEYHGNASRTNAEPLCSDIKQIEGLYYVQIPTQSFQLGHHPANKCTFLNLTNQEIQNSP